MKKFNEERTYGIEIEFINADREEVARIIRDKGIDCRSERYNHYTSSSWKVITDSSCGSELVSPILKGREGLRQLKIVTEALAEAGAKVNRKCGLHIHHDINDYGVQETKNLFSIHVKLEKAIDQLMPNSRRANKNTYCKSQQGIGRTTTETLELIQNVETMEGIGRIFGSRYVKLNYHSYVRYGTIEFRQHSGTIEYEKIYNWLLFTQNMVETAKTRKVDAIYTSRWDTLKVATDVLGLIKSGGADEELANMWKWYRKRAKQLAL